MKDKQRRLDIINLWWEINFSGAAPILIALLEEDYRFWTNGDDRGSLEQARKPNDVYSEMYCAVRALRKFRDPKARAILEATRDLSKALSFNPQIVKACEAALRELATEYGQP